MQIGVEIGEIKLKGQIIEFMKIDGRMQGKKIMMKGRKVINEDMEEEIVIMIVVMKKKERNLVLWMIVIMQIVLGVIIIVKIGGEDMKVVV